MRVTSALELRGQAKAAESRVMSRPLVRSIENARQHRLECRCRCRSLDHQVRMSVIGGADADRAAFRVNFTALRKSP